MKFIGIIPARYASSRFPGKPLADIGGKPMIRWVYERVAGSLDDVWVATDDARIEEAVKSFGGKVIMTSTTHRSGTERCLEAAERIGGSFDVIINIQGDEPFIQSKQIDAIKACFLDHPDTCLATLIKPFSVKDGLEALTNPNSPKVVVNRAGEALYFSRSVIPYLRGVPEEEWLNKAVFYKHIGLYAYRLETLKAIAALPVSPLEQAESLEQLRWLEYGFPIQTAITEMENIAVDTPEDLERARIYLEATIKRG